MKDKVPEVSTTSKNSTSRVPPSHENAYPVHGWDVPMDGVGGKVRTPVRNTIDEAVQHRAGYQATHEVKEAMGIANLEIGPMLSAVDGKESSYKDNNNIQTQSSGLRLDCEGQDGGPQGKRFKSKIAKRKEGPGVLRQLKCTG
ncbi:hypothetical protein Ancab_020075 [Ancistrocladus abbreviatus]